MELLGYNVAEDYPKLPFGRKTVINTINPHSYCIAKQDAEFDKALKTSDVLLPDGIGIVWAAAKLVSKKINKIAGYDIFIYLMKYLESSKGSCFFLGASEATLALIKERAANDFPNVTVHAFSPPYKPEFSSEECKLMVDKVNAANPNIVFVGMTAPKQEKWIAANKSNINVDVFCAIGAVFDFYAETVQRPSDFWINSGLEWLPRFLKEPKRLAKRNLVSTPKFILEVLSYKFFNKGIL